MDDQAEVTARVDLVASRGVTTDEINQAFLDGLDDDMYIGTDSQVVSASVSFPGVWVGTLWGGVGCKVCG